MSLFSVRVLIRSGLDLAAHGRTPRDRAMQDPIAIPDQIRDKNVRMASFLPNPETMRGRSKIMLVVLLAACVGCSHGSAPHVLPDAGMATDATTEGDARSDAAADVKDATDATQNGDGVVDQTTFSCGDASCRAPAEYCYGTEGPGGAFTRLDYNGCNSTPAMCLSDYTCACLAAKVGFDNCIEADGGVTTLIGLP